MLPRALSRRTLIAWLASEREARVLASLNHRHIGDDSRPRRKARARAHWCSSWLTATRLPTGDRSRPGAQYHQAIPIWARQIAECARCRARERLIVHRDLKPANVKYYAERRLVKVLDFGLASVLTTSGEVDDSTRSAPTITSDGGVILGYSRLT